jgi:uncharacterized tellurite resistance protein B-like protein
MKTLEQLKLLISLARADGFFNDLEKNYVLNIARANQIAKAEVEPLFDSAHDLAIPDNLSSDQKFEFMYSLVQLMKIDERMYKEEMQFCSRVATRLGYQPQALFELLLHVRTDTNDLDSKQELRRSLEKYLN